jgi:hypothetical protein
MANGLFTVNFTDFSNWSMIRIVASPDPGANVTDGAGAPALAVVVFSFVRLVAFVNKLSPKYIRPMDAIIGSS